MPEESPVSAVESLPPLPSRGGRVNVPAPEEGVPGESPPPDGAAASSAEAGVEPPSSQPGSEQAPPLSSQPAEEGDVPFGKHPRWIERQRELEETRRQRDEALRLAQTVAERPVQAGSAPLVPKDPWEGLVNHQDPATAQFYQQMQAVVRAERQAAKQEAIAELQPIIDAGRQELARLNLREFRKDNPEIAPGSSEEQAIVAYMNGQVDGFRHPLESAKRNAMFDRLKAENQQLKSKQSALPQKQAAAQVESSSGIPATAGLPGRPGDWRQQAAEVVDKGGDFRDVANTLFGKRRKP